jgi:hypothetical protein
MNQMAETIPADAPHTAPGKKFVINPQTTSYSRFDLQVLQPWTRKR